VTVKDFFVDQKGLTNVAEEGKKNYACHGDTGEEKNEGVSPLGDRLTISFSTYNGGRAEDLLKGETAERYRKWETLF